jgi:hypothetical protein
MVMHCEPFAISVHFTSQQSSQSWTLVNIYGPCNGELRDDFVTWSYNLNIPDNEDWLTRVILISLDPLQIGQARGI